MAHFLAIDAGATSTRLAIGDEERELARVSGASVKVMRHASEDAERRLGSLLDAAATQARVDLRYVDRTCAGMSGASVPMVRAWIEGALFRRLGGTIEVVGDEEIALDAAFRGATGVLVIAGTGSNVVGRCEAGRGEASGLFWAGGWGPTLGDEGSGHWIGVEALRAVLRARDRGVESCLLGEIEGFWGMDTTAELIDFANREPGPEFAGLAPVVARCAAGGDAVAASVLRLAGEQLAEQVSVVVGKMRAVGCEHAEIAVAYTGSVLEHIAGVREAMIRELELVAGVRVVSGAVDALKGALWRARQG